MQSIHGFYATLSVGATLMFESGLPGLSTTGRHMCSGWSQTWAEVLASMWGHVDGVKCLTPPPHQATPRSAYGNQGLLPGPMKVTIYVTLYCHLSFFFFSRTKNLGICESTKDSSSASPCICRSLWIGTALGQPLWRNWPTNVAYEGY